MSNWGARLIRLSVIVLAASFLWACTGDDGKDGATGPQGPQGPTGPTGPAGPPVDTAITIGDGTALTLAEIEELGKLEATITGITVASPPVVDFTVVDQHGNPAVGIAEGVVWFTFAKLVPNTDPAVNGGLPYWQSYINTVEDTTAGTDAVKPDVLDVAVQATTDNSGTLEELGDGQYRYTFATDVANVTTPIAVAYEPNLTHRVGLEIRLGGPGEVPLAPDNPVYDFVPDGGAGSGVSRDIAATENCGNCHYELAIHGGPRKSVEYCVTCHNQGTVDQDTGESMDLAYLAHSIHMGEYRAEDFIVYGFSERFGSANDFSHVTYPQSVAYCETCHVESASHPDGNNWNEKASAKACGGCHVDGLVAENFDAVTGIAEYAFDHAVSDFPGAAVQVDGSCSGCHLGNIPVAGNALSIHSRVSEGKSFSNRWRDELGDDFVFEIIGATGVGPGETPVITFTVKNAAGENWDILTAPEFDEENGASMNLYVGWPSIENYNGDELGATGGFRFRDNNDDGIPDEPSYYGPGHPNRMELDVIQLALLNDEGSTVNADGSYTVTYFTSLPENFTGQAMVAIGGHPAAVDVVDVDGNIGNQRAAASSVVWYPEGAERDFAVSPDKCNACHKDFQFHGSNRNTNIEMCIVCHNADLAASEETFDEGFALGRMVHSIHAASASFGDGGFATVGYPQPIANCDTCHVEGAYNTAREVARSVSLSPGVDETVWTDDPATTPTSQACGTCHMSVAAMGHFNTQGGAVAITKDLIQQVGGLPNGQEACAVCHGPGNEFDTTKYHNPGLEE